MISCPTCQAIFRVAEGPHPIGPIKCLACCLEFAMHEDRDLPSSATSKYDLRTLDLARCQKGSRYRITPFAAGYVLVTFVALVALIAVIAKFVGDYPHMEGVWHADLGEMHFKSEGIGEYITIIEDPTPFTYELEGLFNPTLKLTMSPHVIGVVGFNDRFPHANRFRIRRDGNTVTLTPIDKEGIQHVNRTFTLHKIR